MASVASLSWLLLQPSCLPPAHTGNGKPPPGEHMHIFPLTQKTEIAHCYTSNQPPYSWARPYDVGKQAPCQPTFLPPLTYKHSRLIAATCLPVLPDNLKGVSSMQSSTDMLVTTDSYIIYTTLTLPKLYSSCQALITLPTLSLFKYKLTAAPPWEKVFSQGR